jgi:hypothetical protein
MKADSSWPPLMTTGLAANYCGYRDASALRQAARRGLVRPAGRRGGARDLVWRRSDLDAFLCGGKEGEREQAKGGSRPNRSRAKDRRRPAGERVIEDAIRKIRRLAHGKEDPVR